MDFHFRSQNLTSSRNKTYKYTPKVGVSFSAFIRQYLALRLRQLLIFTNLGIRFSGVAVAEFKSILVRNMYWGRTSFYKTAFHLLVVITTLFALSTGLGSRIVSVQRDSFENISVSSRTYLDSDLVTQQGSLSPLEVLTEDTDNVYFEYVVQAGDTLQKIASDNSLNIDTLRWANNIPAGRDTLSVGQTIKVPKMNGVLYTVKDGDTVDKILGRVQLKDKESDKLTFLELNASYIDEGDKPRPGSTVFIPEAVIPRPVAPPPSRPSGGKVVNPGSPPSGSVGGFVNAMQLCGGYSYSRGYSSGHTGVDLATNPGCWIVAVASGTVVRASWCFSLGYCVIIKHAGGYSTAYGHGNGVFAVTAGQGVVAGQKIMQSGCTGRCFGPHLHLSLAANGNDVYSCYSCRINPRGIIPY